MSVSQKPLIEVGGKSREGLFVNLRRDFEIFSDGLSRLVSQVLLLLIGAYRTIGTTHFGGQCRFEPSCSEYAVEAVRQFSPLTAIRLITLRILKCRPGGDFGFDPLPCSHKAHEDRGSCFE